MAKQPFTDEQKDLLMDYLFNKYTEDLMKSKERSEDFYNQPPSTDILGNQIIKARSNQTNPFMNIIDKGIKNTKSEGIMMASDQDVDKILEELFQKYLEIYKDPDEAEAAAMKEYESRSAKNNNVKQEGIMTARNDRIGTLMNLLEAERMSDNPDLDKIQQYEGELFNLMSPKKAAKGGIMMLAQGGDSNGVKKPETEQKSVEQMLEELRKVLGLDKKNK